MKILVTGASGFIGSFIVEEALRRDMEVWAAVRKSSSRKYLTDERINFIISFIQITVLCFYIVLTLPKSEDIINIVRK